MKEWLKNRKVLSGCAAVALAVVIGGVSMFSGVNSVPEFPSFTDPIMSITAEEEETPLASNPKTTTKTVKSTKQTTKKVKMKKASSKTYTKKLKATKKVTKSSKSTSTETVSTNKTVVTNATEKYKKKSKTKTVVSKITTTVKTTTTTKVPAPTAAPAKTGKYEASVTAAAPKMDSRVLSAFQTLGFKLNVDSSVNYSGYFDARSGSITMKTLDDSVYHELGHFLAFIAGNVDTGSSFQKVYAAEKDKVTAFNKAYVTQNSSEYFAESVKDYILNTSTLKSTRPQTYAAVESALKLITDAQVAKIQKIYGAFWK